MILRSFFNSFFSGKQVYVNSTFKKLEEKIEEIKKG